MNVPGIITVRTYYYGPTDTNGFRMRAVARLDNGRTKQLTVPFPYAASNPDTYVAQELCKSLGYDTARLIWVAAGAYTINATGCVNPSGECPNACQCGCESGLYECACEDVNE